MKLARLLALAFLFAPFAQADGVPVSMEFSNVNGANNGVYYVSPYYGFMNGQPVVLFCDDIKNDVSFGQTWSANVTNLETALTTTNGFANTRYGSVFNSPVIANPGFAYEEAAWLTTQFAGNPTQWVNLQEALWDIMNPGSYSGSGVSYWLGAAAGFASDPNFNPSNFEIVTNVGPLCLTGQVQEFIVQTPEPGTLALLACGVLVLAALTLLRARVAA
jgi:hypothetical protein